MAVVEPNTNDPRAYVCMAALMRQQIAESKLLPGDPAPTIEGLAKEHRHARQTCAKALRLLVDEGLMCVPGLGYYLTPDAANQLQER